jgi:hypothetical protein
VLIEPAANGENSRQVFAYPYFEALRDQNAVLRGMFATTRVNGVFMDRGRGAEQLPRGAALVSGSYFSTFGGRQALAACSDPTTTAYRAVIPWWC